jgi:outer membrane protein OmpA-like peptidoglycan-associated protein
MKKSLAVLLMTCGMLSAQTPAQERRENSDRTAAGLTPIYRVTVTERTTKAISYRNRSGATKIDFAGTALMPAAHGEAKVESKKGYMEIEVEFRNLPEATQFGAEYLTYVLWAITPEGRTSNLGEILRSGTSGKLDVTTELQSFGLVVTAEPYFAVSRPSDVVVMENVVRPDTIGKIELIDAKYELLQRGQYEHLANILDLRVNRKMPLELYEARNAIQIARTSGADRFATETFKKAEADLQQAEAYRARNAGTKPVTMTARHAVQTAEDARAIAVKRQDDDLLALERQATADRQATAENGRTAAELETTRVTREAAEARLRAENEAARLKTDNDAQSASARAEAERVRRDNDVQRIAALNEADRLKRDNDAQRASALSEADRLKLESDAKLAAAQTDLDRAARDRAQAEVEKAELRAKLLLQFNAILQTRDTARGLIVNLSDVLFDTAKFSLRPEAREKLAKVAGIVSGHPGLRLDVEGHTDNVGGDDYNQNLSERRGSAVRDYLTQQGMQQGAVSTRGFGKTQPIASNDTAAGRQQNRRVELVISGEIIGVEIGVPLALK